MQYTYDGAGNRLQIQQPDLIPPTTAASPFGGICNANKSVVLTCDDGSGGSGCDRIYYSTTGITPTASSPAYLSPINITTTATLKFFAIDRSGNSEAVKSQVYVIDKTAPTGTIRINGGSSFTNNTSVTLNLSCTDANGCSQMCFSNNNATHDGTYSTPEPYAVTKAWTVPAGDGLKVVWVRYYDQAGNYTWVGAQITLDTIAPTGAISFYGNITVTGSTTVSLTPSCADSGSSCSYMTFSNDNVTFSDVQSYYGAKTWFLATGDGTKTVYAKYRDSPGNWSQVYSKTILLDTAVPATTASPSAGTYTAPQTVTLTCSDGTGSGCGNIYYTTNGSTPTTSSSVYSSLISISATTTLKYFAKDVAGNSEAVKTQVYTIGGP